MSRRTDIQDATGRVESISGRGTIEAWGTGAPSNAVQGFAPGCIYHRVDGGAGTALYVNEGTFTSSTWVALSATLAAAVITALTATSATITTLTTPALIETGTETDAIGASTVALGTNSATAAALPAGTAKVYPTTAADDTVGVIIHANDKVTGRIIMIGNYVSNKILKVYGPTGAVINGASADAAFSSVSGKGVIAVCLSGSGNTWLMW